MTVYNSVSVSNCQVLSDVFTLPVFTIEFPCVCVCVCVVCVCVSVCLCVCLSAWVERWMDACMHAWIKQQ